MVSSFLKSVVSDPTKWIALILSIISLGVATFASAPHHEFRGMVGRINANPREVTAVLILQNSGNRLETLYDVEFASGVDGKVFDGTLDPVAIKPGEIATIRAVLKVPAAGFAKDRTRPAVLFPNLKFPDRKGTVTGKLPLMIRFMTIDQRYSNRTLQALITRDVELVPISVDGNGRPVEDGTAFPEPSGYVDLYKSET